MSRQERYGTRDLAYSKWHRTLGDDLTYIDIDCLEYCRYCRAPLAFVETAKDVGQSSKSADVTRRLAAMAGLEVWLALYATTEAAQISAFRVRRVHPEPTSWSACSPAEWSDFLESLRTCHPKGQAVTA